MTRPTIAEQFAAAAQDLDLLIDAGGAAAALVALCGATNQVFGSVASSVAALDEDAGELLYVASAGPGAEVITGMRLPLTAGIAGFVASTGQALVVADVRRDPRFAVDIAERTGHVPSSLLVVPITHLDQLVGVLSILDRSSDRPDDLERAGGLAEIAAALLHRPRRVAGAGRALLRAAGRGGEDLLSALDSVEQDDGPDQLTALLATAVAAIRRLPADRRSAAADAVSAVLALAEAGLRRP